MRGAVSADQLFFDAKLFTLELSLNFELWRPFDRFRPFQLFPTKMAQLPTTEEKEMLQSIHPTNEQSYGSLTSVSSKKSITAPPVASKDLEHVSTIQFHFKFLFPSPWVEAIRYRRNFWRSSPISAKTESIFLPLFSCFTISGGSEKFPYFTYVFATVHVILIREKKFERPVQVEHCPKKAIDSVLQISVTTFRNFVYVLHLREFAYTGNGRKTTASIILWTQPSRKQPKL